jgi:8-oxo-dGTP diphosphatase
MARAPVLAAGGIVLRQAENPLIAVVRLRKRNEWVLPKGKLDDGETPRDAAEREVLEETGHDVSVHEFLGTLVYESGGRSKVVHYWRMEANGGQIHDLMDDVKAVDWLPLDDAVERLSRGYERAFLANVGPLALEAAAVSRLARRPRVKQLVPEKRRGRQIATPEPSFTTPIPEPQQPDLTSPVVAQDQSPVVANDVVEAETAAPFAEASSVTLPVEPKAVSSDTVISVRGRHGNVVQKLQDWLRRAVRSDRKTSLR